MYKIFFPFKNWRLFTHNWSNVNITPLKQIKESALKIAWCTCSFFFYTKNPINRLYESIIFLILSDLPYLSAVRPFTLIFKEASCIELDILKMPRIFCGISVILCQELGIRNNEIVHWLENISSSSLVLKVCSSK